MPPAIHRKNTAERAVQTWKNNVISGIASLSKQFPISNWYRLIPQCNITLNLMRLCRQNISLSAHTYLHGEFHFDATMMVPPGTKTMVHNKSPTIKSGDLHAFDAWYVGTAMKYYRCYKLVLSKTGAESTPDTVQFNHHIIQTQKITQADRIHKTTTELTKATRNEPSKNTLKHVNAIIKLLTLLK